ncbi:polyubiquitin-B-like [Durio zibethinus]|uniref:Polyubiquitin-B-like n=1 Tax=Durio zibethinus TaxID=66656 RepID=A0A6P6A5S0_DURZI|nr:polyubiquitin-B-like [Durio zibethinus]XP_022760308.1 polyubiquitin-B-like [Durio zibethinus]
MEPSRAQRPRFDSTEEEIPVYLKLKKTVAWKVKPTETVKNFKALLYEKGIISENIQDLFFAGLLLKDDQRLVDCGIQRNSTLHLVLRNFDGLKLLIKIPSEQRTMVVEARAHDTVLSIKSLIEVTEGIESNRFSLVYEGKLLEEDRTLSSLNVKNESTIFLVFCQKEVLSVHVKALTGEVVKLKVKVTFTVADVKAIAGSMLGVSIGSLFYSGQQLEDSKILACYDIKEESMLEVLHPLFQIFVKTWSGRTLTLDVQQSTTVQVVKDKIFQKLKIPVQLQSIIFAGKRLEEGRDLASYGIQKHCTLCMVFAPSSTIMHMKVSKIGSYVPPFTTVRSVKEMIRQKKGFPVKEVLFRETALHDDFDLEHYGIDKDDTLTVVF